jgi:hypothetical protein
MSLLRSPDLPPLEALVGEEPGVPRSFERVGEALAHVAAEDAAMVTVEAPAASLRREPQRFHPMSSYLALYRFKTAHRLNVGEPDYPADLRAGAAPRWSGEVSELLWIHGKNAPLEEDFLGSPVHRAVDEIWPGCLILADARL